MAQTDDIIMMRDVARREKVHARKMSNFFQYTDHSREAPITRCLDVLMFFELLCFVCLFMVFGCFWELLCFVCLFLWFLALVLVL